MLRALVRCVCLIALGFAVLRWVLVPIRIADWRMAPTLRPHSLKLLNTLAYYRSRPRRGDIVGVTSVGTRIFSLQRVIALPGESVHVKAGRIYINGALLQESYLPVKQALGSLNDVQLASYEVLVAPTTGSQRAISRECHSKKLWVRYSSMVVKKAENHYETLGVPRQASDTQVRKAYRRLVLQFHPDRNPENGEALEQFKRIVDAYETISNPEKRTRYDERLRISEMPDPPPRPSTPQAPRSRPRPVREPFERADYEEVISVWRPRDAIFGIAVGCGVGAVTAEWLLPSVTPPLGTIWSSLVPVAATPVGYQLGRGVRSLFRETLEDPGKEWAGILLPYVFAWAAAVISLLLLPGYEVPNFFAVLGPSAAGAGAAAALGASVGRAFTSVARGFWSSVLGLGIGAGVALAAGGTLAVLAGVCCLGAHWELPSFDTVLSAAVGGSLGAAAASVWGALPGQG